jgi:hypothetical protein
MKTKRPRVHDPPTHPHINTPDLALCALVNQLPYAVTHAPRRAYYSIANSPWPLAMQALAELCWRTACNERAGAWHPDQQQAMAIGHRPSDSGISTSM